MLSFILPSHTFDVIQLSVWHNLSLFSFRPSPLFHKQYCTEVCTIRDTIRFFYSVGFVARLSIELEVGITLYYYLCCCCCINSFNARQEITKLRTRERTLISNHVESYCSPPQQQFEKAHRGYHGQGRLSCRPRFSRRQTHCHLRPRGEHDALERLVLFLPER